MTVLIYLLGRYRLVTLTLFGVDQYIPPKVIEAGTTADLYRGIFDFAREYSKNLMAVVIHDTLASGVLLRSRGDCMGSFTIGTPSPAGTPGKGGAS